MPAATSGPEASTPMVPSVTSEPLQRSYTWASDIPPECAPKSKGGKGLPCALGVDEAGRGPVLGPLVYGIAYCPVPFHDSDLKDIGFADSKALTAEKRDQLLDALINTPDNLGWAIRAMAPQDISSGMLRRRPVNLNAQSSAATVGLIAGVLEAGVDVTEIYVDTVGDPTSYSRLLSSHFPRHAHIKWTVTSKADAIYPIVGAASIAAKVTRDRLLEEWRYAEAGCGGTVVVGGARAEREEARARSVSASPTKRKRGAASSSAVESLDSEQAMTEFWTPGSGYPGDPRTVAYLARTLEPVFGYTGIVRFSWATVKTLLEEKVKGPSSSSPSSAAKAKTKIVKGGKVVSTPSDGRRTSPRKRKLDEVAVVDEDEAADALQPRGLSDVVALLDDATPVVPEARRLPHTCTIPPPVGAKRAYPVKWTDEPATITRFFSAPAASSAGGVASNSPWNAGRSEAEGRAWRKEAEENNKGRAWLSRSLGISSVGLAEFL